MLWLFLGMLACTRNDADSGPDETALEEVDVEVTEHGGRACSNPEQRETQGPFVQVSLGPEWDEQDWSGDSGTQFANAGVLVADLDGQWGPEVFVPHASGDRLYVAQADGTWSLASWIPEGDPNTVGAIAGDYDGDGDLDLYVVHLHYADRLLRNDNGGFTDVTGQAGLGNQDSDGTTATFADLDGDGDLDLLVNNHREDETLGEEMLTGAMAPAQLNRTWLNRGDGTFVEAPDLLPQAWAEGYTFVSGAEDFDGDGVIDVYSANDFGPMAYPNQLFRGPDFEEVEGTGTDVVAYAMGLGIGDLNDDGAPDLLITSWMDLVLLVSDGAGGWYRADQALGLTLQPNQHASWAAELADLDNDGDLDALAMFGALRMPPEAADMLQGALGLDNAPEQPDGAWRNDEGAFTSVAEEWGLDHTGRGRGVAVADLNQDGWLDLIKRHQDGPAIALMARCGAESWLTVDLEQGGMNPDAVGAVLSINGQSRVVRAGGHGFSGAVAPTVHFGLGDEERATVQVRWPDGRTSQVNVGARQRVTITR